MDKIIRINMGPGGSPEAKIEPLGDYAGLDAERFCGGDVRTDLGRM